MKTNIDLAINEKLPEILNLITSNEVVAVNVPTGCGKSVGIPKIVFEKTKMVLFCSQPTIASVLGLFEFQKKLTGNGVGWAAEGSKKYAPTDRIVYATSGHIRRLMLKCFKAGKAKNITFCDILMLDEIHTGSKDNSIIIDLWCEAKKQGVKVPKLILSTATVSGTGHIIERLNAVVFSSTFRHSQVEVRYSKKEYEEPDSELLLTDAAHAAYDLLIETKTHGIVFCSGAGECEDMIYAINMMIQDRSRDIQTATKKSIKVIPCFSQCKREDILTAINIAPSDTIHIVCATNVAESSLTIPDVAWVVDTMTEKLSTIKNGKFHLGVAWISQNSAKQREGRTGRTVKKGICHRMLTKKHHDKLEQTRPIEIRNSPISDTVIELLGVGLDPCKVITELCRERLQAAKTTLVECGCIVITRETHEVLEAEVTNCGKFVVQVPMDVRNAAAMYYYIHGDGKDIKPELSHSNMFWPIAAFTLVDTYGPSLFWFPRRGKNESPQEYQMRMLEYAEDNFGHVRSTCPIESLCSFFETLLAEPGIYTPQWLLSRRAGENCANGKKLKEVCTNMKRICYFLGEQFDTNFVQDDTGRNEKCISKMMPKIRQVLGLTYRSSILIPSWQRYGPSHMDRAGRIVMVDIVKTVTSTNPQGEEVISLSDIQIENKKTGRMTTISSLWFVKSKEKEWTPPNDDSDDDSDDINVVSRITFI
jgi:HrpA-like RNA helicase